MKLSYYILLVAIAACCFSARAASKKALLWESLGTSSSVQNSKVEGATCNYVEKTGKPVMYVVGGRTGVKSWKEKESAFFYYDINDKKWSEEHLEGEKLLHKNGARSGHSTVEYGGKLYIFGGHWGAFQQHLLNELLVLDPTKKTVTRIEAKGNPPSPRYSHAATVVGDKMYIHGGSLISLGGKSQPKIVSSDLHIYNFKTNTWEPALPLKNEVPSPERMGHGMIALEGQLYVFGGFTVLFDTNTGSKTTEYYTDIMKYTISAPKWATVGNVALPKRSGHSVTLVGDTVYLIGGHDEDVRLADILAWNIKTERTQSLPAGGSTWLARQGHCAALDSGVITEGMPIYVFGGASNYRKHFDELHVLYLKPSERQVERLNPAPPVSAKPDTDERKSVVFDQKISQLLREADQPNMVVTTQGVP